MREITDHKVNPANDSLTLTAVDKPGAGGACHEYRVHLGDDQIASLSFQNGPIAEVGVNGITQEILLSVVADRLRHFQQGPYACTENARALQYVEAAQGALKLRTTKRMDRGVEGTHEV